jgi:hypothetical protein
VAELEAIIEKLTAELTRLRQYNEALEKELAAAKGGDFSIETFRRKVKFLFFFSSLLRLIRFVVLDFG